MCFALLVDHNALSRKMENSPTNRDLAMVLHQCEPAQMVGLAWRGFLEFILALTQSYLNCGYDHELYIVVMIQRNLYTGLYRQRNGT